MQKKLLLLLGASLIAILVLTTRQSVARPVIERPTYPINPADSALLEKFDSLPYSEAPYSGAPTIRQASGYMDDAGKKQLAELITAQQAQTKNAKSIPADGPTTAGTTLELSGKKIQLPTDIYIIESGLSECIGTIVNADGTESPAPWHCPLPPVFLLGRIGFKDTIRLEADGRIYTSHQDPELIAIVNATFLPLLRKLGIELIVDKFPDDFAQRILAQDALEKTQ